MHLILYLAGKKEIVAFYLNLFYVQNPLLAKSFNHAITVNLYHNPETYPQDTT